MSTHGTDHSFMVRSSYTKQQTRESLLTVYCYVIDHMDENTFGSIGFEMAVMGELIKAMRDRDPEEVLEPIEP